MKKKNRIIKGKKEEDEKKREVRNVMRGGRGGRKTFVVDGLDNQTLE